MPSSEVERFLKGQKKTAHVKICFQMDTHDNHGDYNKILDSDWLLSGSNKKGHYHEDFAVFRLILR